MQSINLIKERKLLGFKMAIEIEKEQTYLLNSLPADLTGWKKEYTKDVYLPPNTDNPQIRLRQRGDTYFMTKKYPLVEGDLSTMVEETINLSKTEFIFLEANLEGNILEKNRYSIKKDGFIMEVDEYLGNLEPLLVLDIEWVKSAPDEEVTKDFDIKKEITQTRHLAAGKIAGKKYSDIVEYV